MEQLDIKSQSLSELKRTVEGLSEKPFRAKQIYEWLHKKQADSFQEMTNLSVGAGGPDFKAGRHTEISFRSAGRERGGKRFDEVPPWKQRMHFFPGRV